MNSLAHETIQKIRKALEKNTGEGVPEIISLIQELSAKAFAITVEELSEVILKRKSLAEKVLHAASTVAYNPHGVEIESIPEAIQIMGFKPVRNLAISLLLVDSAEGSMSKEEQRDASGFALISGSLAKNLFKMQNSDLGDDAFFCTTLRSYGRMLMSTFLIDDFKEAIVLSHENSIDDAYLEVFGLTPLELSYHLLMTQQLPPLIQKVLNPESRNINKFMQGGEENELVLAAEFSSQLCHLVIQDSREYLDNQVAKLISIFGALIDLDSFNWKALLNLTIGDIREYLRVHSIELIHSKLFGLLQNCVKEPEGETHQSNIQSHSNGPQTNLPQSPLEHSYHLLEKYIQRDSSTLRTAFNMLRHALIFEFNLDESIFFLMTDNGDFYPHSEGSEHLTEDGQTAPTIQAGQCDIFNIALSRKEDVLIENAFDAKIASYIPPWMRGREEVHSFFALPVLDGKGNPFAMIYGSRGRREQITLKQNQLDMLRKCRHQISLLQKKAQENA
ncbi:MAG: HDOD domain-containing protein [Opitutales bacterium]|nr:HDOD domain-containing protein [Opitutales bacterium]